MDERKIRIGDSQELMFMTQRLSRAQLPRRGERGFSLIELLIVLAILAVLTTVVVPNISGMFGYGKEQAYSVDRKTIQHAVLLFRFDKHTGPGSPWGSGTEGHYYPTVDGQAAADNISALLAAAGSNQDYFRNGANGAIWMGLLVNSPEDGITGNTSPDSVHPQVNEIGPYLNRTVESSNTHNGGSLDGSYTWVICRDGKVYGLYWDGSVWKEGYGDTYP